MLLDSIFDSNEIPDSSHRYLVVRVKLAMVSVSVVFSSLFRHYVLYQQAPVLSIFALAFHLSLTLSRYILMLFSHRNLGLPSLLFPYTFWAYVLLASLSSLNLSTRQTHFNLLLTNLFFYI